MSQNLWVLIGKGIAKKIHCCFAVFILLAFVGAAHAAGYTCQSSKRFTSCNTGYYISNCPTSSSSWTGQTISSSALTTGNSCKSCPSGYSCSGGLVCPRKSTITIRLIKNGGSGYIGTGTAMVGGTSSATITCTAGVACALPEWSFDVSASAKNTNIKNGKKIFLGWATTSTATAGSFTIKSTTDRTLYAVWKTPTCSATNGSCSILNASENRPTALISCSTGYSQSGVPNTTTLFTVYGTAGETEVSGSCLANCNTITFNSTQNGGSGGWSTKLYKKTGSTKWFANSTCSVVRTAAITKPTKTNATFAGFYNTSAASGGTQFISSTGALLTTSGLTVTAPTTLYAQYECNTGYTGTGTRISGKCNPIGLTITLNKNGGSGILKTDESQTTGTASAQMLCYYNQPCTLPSWDDTNAEHRNNITNGQKIFTGWSTTQAVREGDTGVFTMTFTANDVVYAVWIQPTCTVTGGHGTCTLRNASQNKPTAYFSCNTGYAQSATSSTTGWQQTGTAGETSVVDECVARQYTCAAGTYLNGTTCSTCQSLYYCPGGTFTYNGASQGDNRCPVTAIDQSAYPWHYASDPGAKAQTDCYVYGNAADFSDYCAAGQWRLYYDSSEGDYKTFTEHSTVTAKPGAYIDDSFHVGPTCTQCTGAKYSAGGDVHECDSCPTIYTDNTTAGKSSANQCQVRTDGGYYIATAQDDEQTQCTTKHYCPSALVNYGSTNSPTACPDPETHLTTEYPDSYYDAKFSVISVQAWFTGGEPWTKETDCRAVYSLDNSRGHLIADNVVYNASTQKYDQFIRWPYYVSINPGYYASSKYDEATCDYDNNTMLYKDAQPCPAGSYCPGLTSMPSCTSGTYNDTLGINACPANYGTSPAQSTANTQCYLTTTAGKWVATKNAAQTSCTAGGFCVGGVKVNYGSTGGRTPAAAGYYVSTTGATTQTACAAGTYTSTTGQTKCTDAVAGTYTTGCKITSNNTACTGTAVCATNTYSDARASVCIACNTTNGYKNIGTDKSAHAGIASCKVYCSDGEYVPVAGDGCVNVGVGYWGVGGTVAQNATLARNACASGLTTIGFGLGADEAGDCGRVLNIGDEKIYLRSTKKTTPSLNISINGDVFYGNMSTATSGGSSLRINSGGATYRVYDDSNPALSHSGGDSGVD